MLCCAVILPVNPKPEGRLTNMPCNRMLPLPDKLEFVKVSDVLFPPEINVPSTISVVELFTVMLLSIVTVTPVGMRITSPTESDSGTSPPHVAVLLKFPETMAVYVMACAGTKNRSAEIVIASLVIAEYKFLIMLVLFVFVVRAQT